ncbi:MAG: 3-deoxy-manno-octulosonate cytidylyltransferase [Holosporaceae bacterium]|jgi:3-deoxy-manno-octulosonate cytidylyltransferase (CMP-KDO synthetase)|nr:3-deoxy-manno-octulosonate cytidylyltransferase [Holosporaceae bacterium]
MKTLIIIPARIASTRLPRKMLADVGGEPLIVKTYKSVLAAGVGDVLVACDGEEIAEVIRRVGGTAILTDPDLQSGTDRVYAAASIHDKDKSYDFVINVQGDMPFVDAEFVRVGHRMARELDYDAFTLATPIRDDSYLLDSVVKPVIAFKSSTTGQALYFSRSPAPNGGPYYHHLGIYCFRRDALERYVKLPQSPLEKIEKLEQLRMLENGMTIGISVLNMAPPISVDVLADLERARAYAIGGD